ncbi:6-phosphofructo-2-kinase 2 [[Candida] jaroonii]|uniref:6-phosphofructo-2-kinase 2 n=1 Tax=[Candida] jaroonii TaxID=467808 RepID=A0ACA9YA63_9ASCO|nr:6-phosphofructo-2-kinase 2 [[Candida] jaroonii]
MFQGSSNSLFSLVDDLDTLNNIKTNDTSTFVSRSNSVNLQDYSHQSQSKNIILLTGLPATGKSTISKQLTEYLNSSTNLKTKIFNCGDKRRQTFKKFNNYEFFDPNNEISKMKRDLIAIESLNLIISELNNDLNIGILDATNTTIERRSNLINLINKTIKLDNLIILDIQCNNEKLINYNIQAKTNNDDYKNCEFKKSIEDFTKRLQNYQKAYQPITDDELNNYDISSYIMIENAGENFHFKNFTHSLLITILNDFFNEYSQTETKRYFAKVNEFYNEL